MYFLNSVVQLQKNCTKSRSSMKRQRTESSSDKTTPHSKIPEEIVAAITHNNNSINNNNNIHHEYKKEPGSDTLDPLAGIFPFPDSGTWYNIE